MSFLKEQTFLWSQSQTMTLQIVLLMAAYNFKRAMRILLYFIEKLAKDCQAAIFR